MFSKGKVMNRREFLKKLGIAAGAAAVPAPLWAALKPVAKVHGPFGDGSDGNMWVSGAVSLNRDMYFNNLTIGENSSLITNGYKVFVSGTLEVVEGQAGSIVSRPPPILEQQEFPGVKSI